MKSNSTFAFLFASLVISGCGGAENSVFVNSTEEESSLAQNGDWIGFPALDSYPDEGFAVASWQAKLDGVGAVDIRALDEAGVEILTGRLVLDLEKAAEIDAASQAAPESLEVIESLLIHSAGAAGPDLQVIFQAELFRSFAESGAAAANSSVGSQSTILWAVDDEERDGASCTTSTGNPGNGFAQTGEERHCYAAAFDFFRDLANMAVCALAGCPGAFAIAAFFGPLAAGPVATCLVGAAVACGAVGVVAGALEVACCQGVNVFSPGGNICSCDVELDYPGTIENVPQPGVSQCISCAEGSYWDGSACRCASNGNVPSDLECNNGGPEPSRTAVCEPCGCAGGGQWKVHFEAEWCNLEGENCETRRSNINSWTNDVEGQLVEIQNAGPLHATCNTLEFTCRNSCGSEDYSRCGAFGCGLGTWKNLRVTEIEPPAGYDGPICPPRE